MLENAILRLHLFKNNSWKRYFDLWNAGQIHIISKLQFPTYLSPISIFTVYSYTTVYLHPPLPHMTHEN